MDAEQAYNALHLYVCTDHATHYPVGGASVVIAHDVEEACVLLTAALATHGLSDEAFTLIEIAWTPAAHVLRDGDY